MTEIEEHDILVSNPVNHESFGEKIVILVVIWGASITFFFFGFTHQPYMEFWLVIPGFILLIIGLINLRKILSLKTFKITDTTLYSTSKIGKSVIINRNEIVSFHERNLEEKSKNSVYKWNELAFFTAREFITVSSRIHPDYKKIKSILTNDLPDFFNGPLYRQREKIERKKASAIRLFVWGIFFISFPILKAIYIRYMASDMKYDQLTEIKGVISTYPEILTTGKQKKEVGVKFELKEYPNFEFKLYEDYFDSFSYRNFKSGLYSGREIALEMSLDEYKKKFSEELPIKFNDKYVSFNSITVFGGKYGDNELTRELKRIRIKPANSASQIELNYLNSAIMYLLVGLFAAFMYIGTQQWREYKELLIESEE